MESYSGNGDDSLISAAVDGSLCLMAFVVYAIYLIPIRLHPQRQRQAHQGGVGCAQIGFIITKNIPDRDDFPINRRNRPERV